VIPPQLAEIGNDFAAQRTWLSCEQLQAQPPRLRHALPYAPMILLMDVIVTAINIFFFFCLLLLFYIISLQCFDAVGWAAGRASGL